MLAGDNHTIVGLDHEPQVTRHFHTGVSGLNRYFTPLNFLARGIDSE
jgi:hypothetical protein